MPKKGLTKRSWRRSLVPMATGLGTIVACIAAFATNILSIRDFVESLFLPEPIKITVHDASATIWETPLPPTEFGDYLTVNFIVNRQGPANPKPLCYGEGNDGELSFFSMTSPTAAISVGLGNEAAKLQLNLAFGNKTPNPGTFNFRLNCPNVGNTPWTPVKVTLTKTAPLAGNPCRTASDYGYETSVEKHKGLCQID